MIAAACFMAILLALIGVGLHWLERREAAQAQAIDSLAVLPLVNASQDSALDYLSEGLTEQLIHSLSQFAGLKKLIAYSSVQRFKSPSPDPQRAAQQLGVRAVLTGRVLLHGDEISIALELVDARDQRRLWGEQYRRKLTDLGTMPEGIARDIAEKLQRQPSPAEIPQAIPRATENSEAYSLYLRGRYLLSKRTRETMTRSIEYFERAIEKDPNFALAHAALGECYSEFPAYVLISRKESRQKAWVAALKALALDDRLTEAHAVLATLHAQEWNWSAAEKEFRRALELNPNYVRTHDWYGLYLARMGRHEEALVEAHRALALDPFSLVINVEVGRQYCYARRYDQAIRHLQATVELDPNYPYTYSYLSLAYEQMGRYDEAVAAWLKYKSANGEGPEENAALKEVYAVSGIKGFWRKQIDLRKERSRQRRVPSALGMAIAHLYAKLGETDQAFECLESAYAERDSLLGFLKANPGYDRLHSDPRFADLLRRVGLPP